MLARALFVILAPPPPGRGQRGSRSSWSTLDSPPCGRRMTTCGRGMTIKLIAYFATNLFYYAISLVTTVCGQAWPVKHLSSLPGLRPETITVSMPSFV